MSLSLRILAGAGLGLAIFSHASANLNWELVEWNGLPLVPSAVTADESLYVAAANDIIMSSTDGREWTLEYQGSGFHITCLTIWDGGIYAGTREGRILYRPADSTDWVTSSRLFAPPEGETDPVPVEQIVIGDDRAVATSRGSFSVSLDGTTWSDAAPLPEDILAFPEGCAFGNGLFMIASYYGTSFAVSPNGTEWAKVNLMGFANMSLTGQLQHANGVWLASAKTMAGTTRALISTNGTSWEQATFPFPQVLSFATSTDEFRVIGRGNSPTAYFARSANGKTWSSVPIEVEDPRGVQYGPRPLYNPFVTKGPAGYAAVESFGNSKMSTTLLSQDGTTWTSVNLPPDTYNPYGVITLAGVEGAYFHDGLDGSGPLYSQDGYIWTDITELMDEPAELVGVLAMAKVETGMFLLTDNRVLLHSVDGEVWSKRHYSVEGFTSQPLLTRLVSFGGSLYSMAAADIDFEHTLVKSEDGFTWTPASGAVFSRRHQIFATDAGLVVHSTEGGDHLSTDGVEWEGIETNITTPALRSSGSMIFGRGFIGEIEQWSLDGGYRKDYPAESNGYPLHAEVVEMKEDDGRYFVVNHHGLHAGTELGAMEYIHAPVYIQNIIVRGNRLIATSDAGILTATLRPKDYIWDRDSNRYATWVESEWFGWLFDGTFPYVYHATQGWQYQIVDPQGNIALYDYGLAKWVWTSQSFYPFYWAYDGEDSGWIYYEAESETPHRWFYDYNTEDWVQEPDFKEAQ